MRLGEMRTIAGGLQGISSTPLAKMALRYWWASIPVGLAVYGKYRERMEKDKKVKLHHVLSDLGSIIGPVMSIIAINELAVKLEQQGKLQPKPASIKDAEYTVQQAPAQTQETPPPYAQRTT